MRRRWHKTTWLVGLSGGAAAAVAALGPASPAPRAAQPVHPFVAPQPVAAAQAHPHAIFRVIVQGTRSESAVLSAIRPERRGEGVGLGRRLGVVNGASAGVTGAQLIALARTTGVAAISLDRPVHLTDLSSTQQWPAAARVQQTWSNATSVTPPAIAVVDSGIQANRPDFGNGARV